METSPTDRQIELLTKIHNQIANLTKLIATVELERTNSQILKNQIRQLSTAAESISVDGPAGTVLDKQPKVIAPTNPNIEPGGSRPVNRSDD